MRKNREIELLRAVAILLTLTQHLGYLFVPSKELWHAINRNPPFWGGVDLFFCVSGFVICKSLVRGATPHTFQQHRARAVSFWMRRFFRIVPSMWLWVGLSLIAARYFNETGAFGDFSADVGDSIAAIFNVANIHILRCIFGHATCGPNPIYWSLSLEEQFYLLLPFALFLRPRTVALITVILIGFQMPFRRMPWDHDFGGILWFFRCDALLLGAAVAYASTTKYYEPIRKWAEGFGRARPLISAALVALLMLIPGTGTYLTCAGIAVVSGALVLLASFDANLLFGKTWITAPFVWVGSRSFSIYLIHMPTFWFVNEAAYRLAGRAAGYSVPLFNNPMRLGVSFAAVLAIICVAELNYRFVEVPIREKGKRIADRRYPLPRNAGSVRAVAADH